MRGDDIQSHHLPGVQLLDRVDSELVGLPRRGGDAVRLAELLHAALLLSSIVYRYQTNLTAGFLG